MLLLHLCSAALCSHLLHRARDLRITSQVLLSDVKGHLNPSAALEMWPAGPLQVLKPLLVTRRS